MLDNEQKIFAVISIGFLGDTVLVEPLCRNIKENFPGCKIIFIANEIFKELALGFESVDYVYGYDKKDKHKSAFAGPKLFAMEFKYKNNVDYAIITHPHERSFLISKAIGAKNIISLPVKKSLLNFFINYKRKYSEAEIRNKYKADYNSEYLLPICKNIKNYPVKYVRNDIDYSQIKNKFKLPENYTVLSPTSKDLIKDWDYSNIKKFIIGNKNKTVMIGTTIAAEISEKLNKDNVDFIDLTNKTSITELAAVIKMAKNCVSVDTGTFHLSYAQGVNTVGLFYNPHMVIEWAPENLPYVKILNGEREEINNNIISKKEIEADDVLKILESFYAKR